MKQIVFRVQDAQGRGPWQPNFSHYWVEDRDEHSTILIPWLEELGPVHKQIHPARFGGCACLTIEHLCKWFTPSEYIKLLELGFHSVEMQVDRIIAQGKVQIVFERELPLKYGAVPFNLYGAKL